MLGFVVGIVLFAALELYNAPSTSVVTLARGGIVGVLVAHATHASALLGFGFGAGFILVVFGLAGTLAAVRTLRHPASMTSPPAAWVVR